MMLLLLLSRGFLLVLKTAGIDGGTLFLRCGVDGFTVFQGGHRKQRIGTERFPHSFRQRCRRDSGSGCARTGSNGETRTSLQRRRRIIVADVAGILALTTVE